MNTVPVNKKKMIPMVVRLTKQMDKQIAQKADAMGMTKAKFIRECIAKNLAMLKDV